MNLFVGNLSLDVGDGDLKTAFGVYGRVTSVILSERRYCPGQSRGYGFVEMPNIDEAEAAVNGLSGKDLKGYAMLVIQAIARPGVGGRGKGEAPTPKRYYDVGQSTKNPIEAWP